MRRGGLVLLATMAVRLLLAIAAVAVETAMVVQGSRPDAELAGLLLPLGLAAAVVTLPYLAVTVVALVGLLRPEGAGVRPATAVAVVDVVVGVVVVGALGRAVVIGDTWMRSPLWFGLVPLVLGALTLALARSRRLSIRPSRPDRPGLGS